MEVIENADSDHIKFVISWEKRGRKNGEESEEERR